MSVSPSTCFRMLCRFFAVLCLLGGLQTTEAQAQTYPHPISLQGILLDANGDPLSGTYDLIFRIYDTPQGGSALWEETQQSVLVSDGLYDVALGLNPSLPPDVFIDGPRYLEVHVGGEVLNPRIELRAVPIAYAAKTLTDGALQAGSNVSITRQAGGTLRIDANGGGGGGGLSTVATDATLDGDGTSGNPLGLDDNAVQAGANVTVTRTGNGAFVVSSTGGGGGLSAVASDATLVGNGTGANPMGLADGAVTGAKMADGALVAGANVTITRQGNGALEIGATGGGGGFSLPFSGSTSSGGAAFSVANTGGGAALFVPSAGQEGLYVAHATGHGVRVGQANDGVNVESASGTGVAVGTAEDGFRVTSAGNDGVHVQSAGRFGLNVVNAVRGVDINTTSSDGMVVRNAGRHGLYVLSGAANGLQIDQVGTNGVQVNQTVTDGIHVQSAGRDGVHVASTGKDGFLVDTAGRHGLKIGNASVHGVQIDQTTVDGMRVTSAGNDGVHVQSAGRFGLNVVNALRGVDINTTSSDGVVVRNAGTNGLRILDAGDAGVRVEASTFTGLVVTNPGNGTAAVLGGDVLVAGTLTKGGGAFRIDHPLDPANKYLAHSFVESPDMKNVYDGTVVLNAAGEAFVTLPDYFETLNRDFRYQLTAIGAPGPNLYIAEEIQGNQFRIAGGSPGMKVSWQVTGIRQDAWAEENRIVVEQDKKPEERGFYLHPKLYGQPETRSMVRLDTPDDF